MRSPSWTRACWMWRGCLSSFRYSMICVSERRRPNQVLHQKRKGMSTIAHAVTEKSNRLRVDMRWRGEAAAVAAREVSAILRGFVSDVSVRLAISSLGFYSAFDADGLLDAAPFLPSKP